MDQIFLSKQKALLLSEKNRLDNEIKETSKYPEMGTSDDDREQEVAQFEDNQSIETPLEEQREEVTAALKRIENGTYGKCTKCGGDIPTDRLEAYPAADDCIKCSGK